MINLADSSGGFRKWYLVVYTIECTINIMSKKIVCFIGKKYNSVLNYLVIYSRTYMKLKYVVKLLNKCITSLSLWLLDRKISCLCKMAPRYPKHHSTVVFFEPDVLVTTV